MHGKAPQDDSLLDLPDSEEGGQNFSMDGVVAKKAHPSDLYFGFEIDYSFCCAVLLEFDRLRGVDLTLLSPVLAAERLLGAD